MFEVVRSRARSDNCACRLELGTPRIACEEDFRARYFYYVCRQKRGQQLKLRHYQSLLVADMNGADRVLASARQRANINVHAESCSLALHTTIENLRNPSHKSTFATVYHKRSLTLQSTSSTSALIVQVCYILRFQDALFYWTLWCLCKCSQNPE